MSNQPAPHNPAGPRRPLKTRQRAWPNALAGILIRLGLTPNQISVLSILSAGISACAFFRVRDESAVMVAMWLLLAAAGIQLRLLCNLLDGLMAVEGGLKSTTGNLYNDLPDRISDSLILVATGYSIANFRWAPPVFDKLLAGPVLGWTAALLAVFTAYIRLLGASTGTTQYFIGPMAKQHRMGLLTVVCLLAAICQLVRWQTQVVPLILTLGLCVIIAGSLVTCLRRLLKIARDLNSQ